MSLFSTLNPKRSKIDGMISKDELRGAGRQFIGSVYVQDVDVVGADDCKRILDMFLGQRTAELGDLDEVSLCHHDCKWKHGTISNPTPKMESEGKKGRLANRWNVTECSRCHISFGASVFRKDAGVVVEFSACPKWAGTFPSSCQTLEGRISLTKEKLSASTFCPFAADKYLGRDPRSSADSNLSPGYIRLGWDARTESCDDSVQRLAVAAVHSNDARTVADFAEAVVPDLPKTAYSVQPCIDDVRPLAQRGASDDPAISDATFIQGFMRHVDVVTSTRHVIDNTRKSRERRIPGLLFDYKAVVSRNIVCKYEGGIVDSPEKDPSLSRNPRGNHCPVFGHLSEFRNEITGEVLVVASFPEAGGAHNCRELLEQSATMDKAMFETYRKEFSLYGADGASIRKRVEDSLSHQQNKRVTVDDRDHRRMMNAVKLEKYGAPDATIPVVQASLQREDEGGKRGFVMMAGDSAAAIPTDQYDGHPESVIWGITSGGFDLFDRFGRVILVDDTFYIHKQRKRKGSEKKLPKRSLFAVMVADSEGRGRLAAYFLPRKKEAEFITAGLKAIKDAVSSKLGRDYSPFVVVSDGDAAESKAFQEAFPRVAHQLCAWHFWRDMAAVMKFGLTAAEGRDLTNKIANHFWRIVKCSPCPQGREEVIYHITCIAQLLGVINDDETGTQRTVIEEREFQFATVVAKLRALATKLNANDKEAMYPVDADAKPAPPLGRTPFAPDTDDSDGEYDSDADSDYDSSDAAADENALSEEEEDGDDAVDSESSDGAHSRSAGEFEDEGDSDESGGQDASAQESSRRNRVAKRLKPADATLASATSSHGAAGGAGAPAPINPRPKRSQPRLNYAALNAGTDADGSDPTPGTSGKRKRKVTRVLTVELSEADLRRGGVKWRYVVEQLVQRIQKHGPAFRPAGTSIPPLFNNLLESAFNRIKHHLLTRYEQRAPLPLNYVVLAVDRAFQNQFRRGSLDAHEVVGALERKRWRDQDSKRDSAALFYDIADEYVMYGKVLRQARAEFWPFRPTDAPLVNGKKPTAAVDFDFTFVRSSSQNAKWWEGEYSLTRSLKDAPGVRLTGRRIFSSASGLLCTCEKQQLICSCKFALVRYVVAQQRSMSDSAGSSADSRMTDISIALEVLGQPHTVCLQPPTATDVLDASGAGYDFGDDGPGSQADVEFRCTTGRNHLTADSLHAIKRFDREIYDLLKYYRQSTASCLQDLSSPNGTLNLTASQLASVAAVFASATSTASSRELETVRTSRNPDSTIFNLLHHHPSLSLHASSSTLRGVTSGSTTCSSGLIAFVHCLAASRAFRGSLSTYLASVAIVAISDPQSSHAMPLPATGSEQSDSSIATSLDRIFASLCPDSAPVYAWGRDGTLAEHLSSLAQSIYLRLGADAASDRAVLPIHLARNLMSAWQAEACVRLGGVLDLSLDITGSEFSCLLRSRKTEDPLHCSSCLTRDHSGSINSLFTANESGVPRLSARLASFPRQTDDVDLVELLSWKQTVQRNCSFCGTSTKHQSSPESLLWTYPMILLVDVDRFTSEGVMIPARLTVPFTLKIPERLRAPTSPAVSGAPPAYRLVGLVCRDVNARSDSESILHDDNTYAVTAHYVEVLGRAVWLQIQGTHVTEVHVSPSTTSFSSLEACCLVYERLGN